MSSSVLLWLGGYGHDTSSFSTSRLQPYYLLRSIFPYLLLLLSLKANTALCETLQITDHQAAIGKLYYYRLPVVTSELSAIKHVEIKEVDKPGLPSWLILNKGSDSWQLIGFPLAEDKGNHYFMVEVIQSDGSKLTDVFSIDVTDYYAHFPTSLGLHSGRNNNDCIIQIVPSFSHVEDVWKVIDYLVPTKLRQEIEIPHRIKAFSDKVGDLTDLNILISEWSFPLFTISRPADSAGLKHYRVTIDKQRCDSKNAQSSDDFQAKLKEMGLNFHHMQVIKPKILSDELFMDNLVQPDHRPVHLQPSRALNEDSYVPASIELNNRRRRHPHPYHPPIYSTPSLDAELMITKSIEPDKNNEIDLEASTLLTHKVPSLSSPSASPASIIAMNNRPQIGATPVFGRQETIPNFFPDFYHTPTMSPQAPTMTISDGISTPHLMHSKEFKSEALISPSPVATPLPTPVVEEIKPSLPPRHTEPPGIVEVDHRNTKPELRSRLPKLAIIAGKYWHYRIPPNTFQDQEDGPTPALKLGFYRRDVLKGRDHIPKDFWIQLDSENQVLMAFPTENDAGVHEFFLEAIDSGGLPAAENISIHVRQHPYTRTFPYTFTFSQVSWDPLKMVTTVEALKQFGQMITQAYGDKDLEHFIVLSMTKDSIGNNDFYTLVTTNESIPAYPCPKEIIHKLYTRIASLNKNADGQYAQPNELLLTKMGKTFQTKGIGLSINCSKSKPSAVKPQIRNPIDILRVKLGEVFRHKIPSNVFYAGPGRDTYSLELNIYDDRGHVLGRNNFLKFDDKTYEIVGLAVEHQLVGDHEFLLVGRDRESGDDASDAFVISVENPWSKEEHGFYVTIGLKLSDDMDIDYKLDISTRIATLMFNDSDCTALRVLKIEKRNYTLIPSHDHEADGVLARSEGGEDENSILTRQKRFTDSFESSEGSIDQMYEFTWTNATNPLLVKGSCPSEAIQSAILEKLLGYGVTFMTWEKIFADKYRLIAIEFSVVGKCISYLTDRGLYRDNLKPRFIHMEHQSESDSKVQHSDDKGFDSGDIQTSELEDYYLKTFVPLILVVVLFLILTCIALCFILKCRHPDKDRFEVRVAGDGYPAETDMFLQKGRVPVIFESELQQHLLSSSPMSFNPSSHQQHVPMRHMNTSYQPLQHPSYNHRRQPPPYK